MAHTDRTFAKPSDEFNDTCPICLEPYDQDQHREAHTSCAHSLCQPCLRRTLAIKPFCPLCRQYQPSATDIQPRQLDEDTPWSPEVLRAFYSEEYDRDGHRMRTVHLSNGESTNIHVSPGVKINMSPSTNLIINGKRIQDPSDCNQQ